MNIITGYRGEPHITSAQSRDENKGSFGVNSYILNVGQKLQAEIVSANEVRIRDGALSHQGCVASIDSGAYDSLEIANGTQGMQRRDLIVARYTKDAETNVEDISLVVIQGTAVASNPSDPAYNTGNIQNGDSPVDMPLYRVNISGVTISSVTQIAAAVRTQAELGSAVDTLNSKNADAWEYIGSLSNSALNNASIQIANYQAYSFFIVDMVMQGWSSVYVIPAKYTTNVQMQFGYNKGSSCNANYSGTAMTFSSPSFPSDVTSIGAVRLYGIRR